MKLKIFKKRKLNILFFDIFFIYIFVIEPYKFINIFVKQQDLCFLIEVFNFFSHKTNLL